MPLSSVLGASSVIKPGVCTSTTRPSVPYEGQLIYETDTDRVASYNGSAWVYTATGGLVLVKTQTIGTTVSSVEVTGAFSSTYDNYKITVSGGVCSTSTNMNLQLGSTTTGYYAAQQYVSYSSGATAADGRNNQASFIAAGTARSNFLSMNVDLFSPNLAKNTTYYGWFVHESQGGYSVGVLQDTTSYTAFTIAPASGTITGGTIRVYGYPNS